MENKWSHEYLIDNTKSKQALNRTEWQTVDISDIYYDKANKIHVIVRDRVKDKWFHYTKELGRKTWDIRVLKTKGNIKWIRIIELKRKVFYLLTSSREIFLMNAKNDKTFKLKNDNFKSRGIYPYIASSKNGTSDRSDFLDVLILNGSSKSYPDASNYYLKVSKSWVLKNLN